MKNFDSRNNLALAYLKNESTSIMDGKQESIGWESNMMKEKESGCMTQMKRKLQAGQKKVL